MCIALGMIFSTSLPSLSDTGKEQSKRHFELLSTLASPGIPTFKWKGSIDPMNTYHHQVGRIIALKSIVITAVDRASPTCDLKGSASVSYP